MIECIIIDIEIGATSIDLYPGRYIRNVSGSRRSCCCTGTLGKKISMCRKAVSRLAHCRKYIQLKRVQRKVFRLAKMKMCEMDYPSTLLVLAVAVHGKGIENY